MKIAAPATCAHEVETFAHLGADEFYCGVVAGARPRDEGNFFNRRPTPEGNLFSFAALKDLTDTAHALEKEISFVLNETYVPEAHLPGILASAGQAAEAGVDAFIVADPVVITRLAEAGLPPKLYLSTCGNCFNAAAVSFFLDLGVSRIILPRHMRIDEIRSLCRAYPGVEFEVVALGDPCRWDDGLCTFEHNLHLIEGEDRDFCGGACSKSFDLDVENDRLSEEAKARLRTGYADLSRLRGCGLCALMALKEAGVAVIKTTGRDNALLRGHYLRYLALAREILADPGLTQPVFQLQAREIRARMHADFVAGHTLRLVQTVGDPAVLGRQVQVVAAESWLLECDPPHSCYFPDAFLAVHVESGDVAG